MFRGTFVHMEITTVDLDAPPQLWARWVAQAAALATIGYRDVYWIDGAGAHHDDHGGNWSRLTLIDGDRAVLFGYDHEYSRTVDHSPPIDLLAGAPEWLPWADLTRAANINQLGYVYWYERAWHRVAYPPDLGDDGLLATVREVIDDEQALLALREIVFRWGRHTPADPVRERVEVDLAANQLLAGAYQRSVHEGLLANLLGRVTAVRPDPHAGVAAAALGGGTPGSAAPFVPATPARPARRRVRRLSDEQHQELVWTAMRQSGELHRPEEPIYPPPVQLIELVDWARGRAPAGDGRCSVKFQLEIDGASEQPGEHAPAAREGEDSFRLFREASDLARAVWSAEDEGGRGRWLFLRLETTADGYHTTRCWDSWPDWWEYDGITGPWLDQLNAEMTRRSPHWRPDWAVLLEPDIAWSGPPDRFAHLL
jgi:hypothetical protein